MRSRDVAFLCVIGAIVVALFGGDGWGWFLLAAVLLS